MSVITPAYNASHHLRRVVESVAAQSVPVLEHIIIDDGSTDDTPRVLQELGEEYPHLRILLQKRTGAAAARNKGTEAARGRYIAFLDADDLWHPDKVERQLRFMEEQKCAFSFGDYMEVDHSNLHPLKRYTFPETVNHKQLLRGCPIGCLTVAYNQEVLGKRYMPLVTSGHDWGLWLELTREGVQAFKYPGMSASYSNGKKTLSGKKIRKAFRIYHLYRTSEQLPPLPSFLRVVEHSLLAFAKKKGIIYKHDTKTGVS